MSFTLHGLAVSGGIAIGQAHLISQATLEVSHLDFEEFLASYESMTLALATHLRELTSYREDA